MSACGREFHIACMRIKSSSFEAAGRGSRVRRRPTKSHTHRWFAVRGILYKGTLARNPRGSRRRRNDEAEISTPVEVDQRGANYLDQAVRSFISMRYRLWRADATFHRPLPAFRVVRYSSVHCFRIRITVELFRCTRAPIVR
ncbi:uncharacterized protein TNCV_1430021 [Trichonephila clavipes]|nr:uncharacterized protein TNCV_1430021 [Trichonephila clavipes]